MTTKKVHHNNGNAVDWDKPIQWSDGTLTSFAHWGDDGSGEYNDKNVAWVTHAAAAAPYTKCVWSNDGSTSLDKRHAEARPYIMNMPKVLSADEVLAAKIRRLRFELADAETEMIALGYSIEDRFTHDCTFVNEEVTFSKTVTSTIKI